MYFLFLFKVQDRLEESPTLPRPVSLGNKELVVDITWQCRKAKSKEAKELAEVLSKPHLRALISSHDEIAEEYKAPSPPIVAVAPKAEPEADGMTGEAIRMVGIRKRPGQPLGLTVRNRCFILILPIGARNMKILN